MSMPANQPMQEDRGAKQTPTTFPARAFGAASAGSALGPLSIKRRAPGAQDVQIEITHCGVCHSDLHQVRNEWQSALPTEYPCVPGHEIVGRVAAVGSAVKKFHEGDVVAVGCMVDSCRNCASCREGLEQYCEALPTFTYNLPDKHLGGVTYGGYSESIVVDEAFVLRVPPKLNPAAAAPLLCAGITTYSPLRHWKVGKGMTVGIIGLGGLGHMAVKFANALGARVILFTTSERKVEDGKRLGAHEVVVSKDEAELVKRANTLDFLLNTASALQNPNPYLDMLKRDCTMVQVGAPEKPLPLGVFSLLFKRRALAGSAIGGIRETQEMLDFCAANGIAPDIELIPIQKINEAYERLLRGDVKYRFVIDLASLKTAVGAKTS
jgi:alcohol dehydrogenase (NADP+)